MAIPVSYEYKGTKVMVTFMQFLLKITARLLDKICYYASHASHMNEPSLNDSEKL